MTNTTDFYEDTRELEVSLRLENVDSKLMVQLVVGDPESGTISVIKVPFDPKNRPEKFDRLVGTEFYDWAILMWEQYLEEAQNEN